MITTAIISTITSITFLAQTGPVSLETTQSSAKIVNQRIAQTYTYETKGDRVNVNYKPRGWFDYFPRYPLAEEYDDLSDERERYPETRAYPGQERYLERRDDQAQEEYLESRNDTEQEQYLEED